MRTLQPAGRRGFVLGLLPTVVLLGWSVPAAAQQGAFPDATFDVMFRKYLPPANAFSPYDSWDAHMALDLTVSRVGASAVRFESTFQTVGTRNIGRRISVGGTGYVIRARYDRALSPDLSVSAGVSHLSSHLTRDLDQETAIQRATGAPIPQVLDAHEYNAVFVAGRRRFSSWPLTPTLDVVFLPGNFRFDGRRAAYVRPLFLATRAILWSRRDTTIALETQHEIGRRAWNYAAVFLEMYRRQQAEGRFQLFLSVSPGSSFHVSSDVGGLRDGIAFGVRMVFESVAR